MKASEGIARIDSSLLTAQAAIEETVAMFQGTAPPPPWPSPELYRAIDDAKDMRDRLDVFARHGDPDFSAKTPQVARVHAELDRRVSALELEAKRLRERREVVAQRTPTALIEKVKAASKSPKWIGLGILGYLLYQSEKRGSRR
jgi:hypothetical protein